MCVDFTDLNKACPKDSFPLPNIDRLVDLGSLATKLHGRLFRVQPDKDGPRRRGKDVFYHRKGNLLWKAKPRNAVRSQERGSHVSEAREQNIRAGGMNVNVEVDDMLVKSREAQEHTKDLAETFQVGGTTWSWIH